MNLTAKVPGWNRYWLAADKLGTIPKASAGNEAQVVNRTPSGAITPLDASRQEALFRDFLASQKKQGKNQ